MLLISPERGLTHLLNLELRDGRIATATAPDLQKARVAVAQTPALIIVDLKLLRTDQAIRDMEALRAGDPPPPVLLLVSEDMDHAERWRFDVDDYIVLPATTSCIRSRAVGLLRGRAGGDEPISSLSWGEHLTIDFERRRVTVSGQQIRLSQPEWRLLRLLARGRGDHVSTHDLLVATWGAEGEEERELLAAWIQRMRRRLEPDLSAPTIILGDTTRGYALSAPYPREIVELEQSIRR